MHTVNGTRTVYIYANSTQYMKLEETSQMPFKLYGTFKQVTKYWEVLRTFVTFCMEVLLPHPFKAADERGGILGQIYVTSRPLFKVTPIE